MENFRIFLVLFSCETLQTTLLNHILTAEHGKRIAVIENEVRDRTFCASSCGSFRIIYLTLHFVLKLQFGEVDIDGSLVAAKTTGAEDIVMLNNGCLCCTVRGDLVRMISELVNKKKGKFDHIVIETTGMKSFPIMRTNSFCSDECASVLFIHDDFM